MNKLTLSPSFRVCCSLLCNPFIKINFGISNGSLILSRNKSPTAVLSSRKCQKDRRRQKLSVIPFGKNCLKPWWILTLTEIILTFSVLRSKKVAGFLRKIIPISNGRSNHLTALFFGDLDPVPDQITDHSDICGLAHQDGTDQFVFFIPDQLSIQSFGRISG